MNYHWIISLILICHFYAKGQIFQNSGALSTSMSGLNVNNEDIWSVNNNISQLSKIKNPELSISSFQPFLVKDFTTSSIVFGVPTKKGAFGINFSTNGNKHLQMHNVGFGYSQKLGENFQSGIKLNYFMINAGDYYNKRSVISTDIGFSSKLSNELQLGICIKNPTFTKLSNFDDERLATNFQLAAGYKFSNELILHTGVEKNIFYPASFLAAIEYQPSEKIFLSGGIKSNPSIASFGVSMSQKQFTICAATQIHQFLGWSPDLSIIYQFK